MSQHSEGSSGARELEELLGGKVTELRRGQERYALEIQSEPPCTEHCPAGVNVKAYVNYVADQRYSEAYDTILQRNPFPGICGRVCTHPCEEACDRGEKAEPLAIRHMKRFAADSEMSRRPLWSRPAKRRGGERVAVIGAGPAGLTAATDLAKVGFAVTVYEAEPEPGGMLYMGIPEYRLPRRVLDHEIRGIETVGVDIEGDHDVSDVRSLLSEGYSAVVIAAGAVEDRPLGIEGDGLGGVEGAISFLRRVKSGSIEKVGGKVLVIGGGSSAFDAARTALRLGADEVRIVYRRTEDEMPAAREELEHAREEGVGVTTLAVPKRLIGEARVSATEFLRAELGEEDASGRRRPVPIEGSEFTIEADLVITAIGSRPRLPALPEDVALSRGGLIVVDETGSSGNSRVFAAGDVVLGPSSVVEAIGSGHAAALGVMKRLGREVPVQGHVPMPIAVAEGGGCGERVREGTTPAEERRKGFSEVELCAPEYKVIDEARRCLHCGSCHECVTCLATCDYKQVIGTIGDRELLMKVPSSVSESLLHGGGPWTVASERGEVEIKLAPLTPIVDKGLCIGCGLCEASCAYRAITVELKRDGGAIASVCHDVCRSCGACGGACPTGAIAFGPFTGQEMIDRTERLAGDRPLVFSCYWSGCEPLFSREVAQLMCTRALDCPTVLLGLAKGSPGVLVSSCPDEEGCHYLPAKRSGEETVQRVRELFTLVGIDPRRVRSVRASRRDLDREVRDYSEELEGNGIRGVEPMMEEMDELPPLEMGLRSLRWLMEHSKDGEGIRHIGPGSVGELVVLDRFLRACGIEALSDMAEAVLHLLGKDVHSVDASMRTADVPSTVSGRLMDSSESGITIAIQRDPEDQQDHDALKRALGSIGGLEIISIDAEHVGPLWREGCDEARVELLRQLRTAHDAGASVFLCPTARSMSNMGLITNNSTWRQVDMDVKDPFTFIKDLLGGGGTA